MLVHAQTSFHGHARPAMHRLGGCKSGCLLPGSEGAWWVLRADGVLCAAASARI